jgi:hypothetical protein
VEKALKTIKNKTFGANEEVLIDGCVFEHCRFDNCTLIFRGGDHRLLECVMTSPKWRFELEAARTLKLANTLADEFPEVRNVLFPNWKKWKEETIH